MTKPPTITTQNGGTQVSIWGPDLGTLNPTPILPGNPWKP